MRGRYAMSYFNWSRGGVEVGGRLDNEAELRGREVLLDVEHTPGVGKSRRHLLARGTGLPVLVCQLVPASKRAQLEDGGGCFVSMS